MANGMIDETPVMPQGWRTLDHEPEDGYGIGMSAPLVFRTKELSTQHIHLRLGYYNRNEGVFYEGGPGPRKAWLTNDGTHWFPLPLPPDLRG